MFLIQSREDKSGTWRLLPTGVQQVQRWAQLFFVFITCISLLVDTFRVFVLANHITTATGDFVIPFVRTALQDDDSSESISFRLAHPLCLVTAVGLRPFLAFFQRPRCPIYAPKRVRIRLGGIACYDGKGVPLPVSDVSEAAESDLKSFDAIRAAIGGSGQVPHSESIKLDANEEDEGGRWIGPEWVSKEYDFRHSEELQTLSFPAKLCIGGYLRIDLLGRTETQDADDRYYSESIICMKMPIMCRFVGCIEVTQGQICK